MARRLADADGPLASYEALQRSGRLVQSPGDPLAGFWLAGEWLLCDDGKARAVEPRTFPLAHGLSERGLPMTFKTAAEALAAWDAGDLVTTVELGGLGPGYEQAIQVCAFELIRDFIASKIPITADNLEALDAAADATVRRIDSQCGGFSWAQVGAAKWLAFRTLRDGWETVIEAGRKKEQTITVSRTWPHVPVPEEVV